MPYSFFEFQRNDDPLTRRLPPSGLAQELMSARAALEQIGVLTEDHIAISLRFLNEQERATLLQLRAESGTLADTLTRLPEYLRLLGVGHARALAAIDSIERRRPPLLTEPQRILPDDIVVFAKVSKFEWDMRQLSFTSDAELLQHYRREGKDIDAIIEARDTHNASVRRVQEILGAHRVKSYWEWAGGQVPPTKLVIMLGGDDTFKAGSQLIRDSFALGLNSDVFRSVGAHLRLDVAQLESVLARLAQGEFQVEEWTRLLVQVNGDAPFLALDELYIGEMESRFTGRATIEDNARVIRAKGSGILVATGSGSTGWFRSATHSAYSGKNIWPRTALHAEYAVREPYGVFEEAPENGVLTPGARLVIRSSHNKVGIISPDCVRDVPFPRGNSATVTLGTPLKVLSFARPWTNSPATPAT